MDKKEILQVVDVVSNEKDLPADVIFQTVEAALAAAYRKISGEDILVRVRINQATGDYEAFRQWMVVPDDQEEVAETREVRLSDPRSSGLGRQVGEAIEEPLEKVEFGRIATQTAKQVLVQKVKEAEREKVAAAYQSRIGQLVVGQVKRIDKGNIIIDMGENAEAFLTRDEIIPKENLRSGDRVCCYLKELRAEVKGPQLMVSRTAPQLLVELFRREVPEINEGLVEVVGAARDPGIRAKIAVRATEARIDPIGACVGMHGTRVQSVSNELAGERIDIVLANENPAQFVINALSPADKVTSITLDEETGVMDVAVAEDQLALAIGKGGQNVRLASELTGWELNIMSEEQADEKQREDSQSLIELFVEALDVDEELAEVLVAEGFSTVEEVAYVPISELNDIEEFDEEIVQELRSRAQDALLIKQISEEEHMLDAEPSEELLRIESMPARFAYKLAAAGINSVDDLADQSVDELLDIEPIDRELAASLIMAARESWFADEEEQAS